MDIVKKKTVMSSSFKQKDTKRHKKILFYVLIALVGVKSLTRTSWIVLANNFQCYLTVFDTSNFPLGIIKVFMIPILIFHAA